MQRVVGFWLCSFAVVASSGCGGVDADPKARETAEWILALGGTLKIFEKSSRIDSVAELPGASFAIENWAANALWTPWIAGMKKLNDTLDNKVDLGYLTYQVALIYDFICAEKIKIIG